MDRSCSMEMCERPVHGRGLCGAHYKRARLAKELPPRPRDLQAPPVGCKPIPGFPYYWASSVGDVYSTLRGRPCKRSPRSGRGGYLTVTLQRGPEVKNLPVHRVIALAFHGLPLEGQEVRHLDGNKLNNAASNLAWGTHVENMDDRAAHGRVPLGEDHHNARFTAQQIADIRAAHSAGESQYSLAKRHRVSKTAIWKIVRGKVWAHVA